MNDEKTKRRSRFKPSDNGKVIKITERDVKVFECLARYRFLTADLLKKFLQIKSAKFLQRLSDLYHTGFIDRPQAQIQYFSSADNLPTVYALATKGKQVLIEKNLWLRGNFDYTAKNKKVRRDSLKHTLLIAEIMAFVEEAVLKEGAKIIPPEEIQEKVKEQIKKTALSLYWQVLIQDNSEKREIGIIPDFVFGITTKTGSKHFYFLEADRGTMPINRSRPRQTSLSAKFKAYLKTHELNKENQMLGFRNFKTIFVVPSEKRLLNMSKALSEITNEKGSDILLFSSNEEFARRNPFSEFIRNGKGEEIKFFNQ